MFSKKITLSLLKAERKTPVLLFLTATIKAYSSRNQTQNNQQKKLLQYGKYCRLMVWQDFYSQVHYFLFKNKTGSKEVEFEKLANYYVKCTGLFGRQYVWAQKNLKHPTVILTVSQITTLSMQLARLIFSAFFDSIVKLMPYKEHLVEEVCLGKQMEKYLYALY